VEALGADARISKSEVSRMCQDIDGHVEYFRTRALNQSAFPYVFLDATRSKAQVRGKVASHAVAVAPGVRADGRGKVMGVDVVIPKLRHFGTSS